MIRKIVPGIILLTGLSMLHAQAPDWLSKRPRSTEFFYGKGKGRTVEEAESAALQEIRLQFLNQINSMIRLQTTNNELIAQAREKAASFIDTIRLRGAEIEDNYQDGEMHYALAKYPEGGGLTVVQSLALVYQQDTGIAPERFLDVLGNGVMVRGARIDRVLSDAAEGDYGDKVAVLFSNDTLRVQVLAFNPYRTNLTRTQKGGLQVLINALAEDLQGLKYSPVKITGHANPTGIRNEEDKLMSIARERARTMAEFLRQANIEVGDVISMGGRILLGSTKTEKGKRLNRRVEVETEVELW